MNYKDYIASIPGFPKEGIVFRDVTPILENPEVLKEAAQEMAAFAKSVNATKVIGPESRGFWFGIPVAEILSLPFIPVRKPGKLPRKTVSESYALEYGTDTLQMHADALQPGDRVVIIDDLMATGGTVEAIVKMVKKMGATPAGAAFVIELDDLKGIEKLQGIPTLSLVHYEGE